MSIRRFPYGSYNKMNPQAQKVKVFFRTAVALSILGTVLYTLAHLLATDDSGYFTAGHSLPLLVGIRSFVSVLWFACALFLIPKSTLPTEDFASRKPTLSVASMAPVIGSLAAALICFTARSAQGTVGLCAKLGLFTAVASVAYFLLRLFGCDNLRALLTAFGIAPILLAAALCGVTYFDQSTYMNSPIKIGFQLAFITMMLFMTGEIRFTVDAAQPRRYLATACIALYANAVASIPQAVYLFKGDTSSYANLAFAVLCLGNCLYVGCRLYQFTKFCATPISEAPATEDAQDSPDQIQGKDTCDGCQ